MANKSYSPTPSQYLIIVNEKNHTSTPLNDWTEALEKAKDIASEYGDEVTVQIAQVKKTVQVKFPPAKYIFKEP
jgi:hypothetical protein